LTTITEGVGSPLALYLADAARYSYLTPEQEKALALAWRDRKDEAALKELIGSHLRLVIKIARGFLGYGLPIADLIAEGNVGLMQAAQKFDPDREARFGTYATWWIRAAIQEYVLHTSSVVKMGTTAAQKKLFFNLRRLKAEAGWQGQGDMPPELVAKIAAELDVPDRDVIEMNRRMAGADGSLNATMTGDGDTEWLERIADDRPDQETRIGDAEELAERRRLLGDAMAKLNDREREIILRRRLSDAPETLEELGQRFKVSRERIRQVEESALGKLRKAMLAAARSLRMPTQLAQV
jgi:RNA polymerase sigma-32 factor